MSCLPLRAYSGQVEDLAEKNMLQLVGGRYKPEIFAAKTCNLAD
jgi:hypothetical protein